MGVILFAIISTVFGFVPTGLVALSHAIGAWSGSRRQADAAAIARRRQALKWCWISVGIGVLVEVPVLATLLVRYWHVSPHWLAFLGR